VVAARRVQPVAVVRLGPPVAAPRVRRAVALRARAALPEADTGARPVGHRALPEADTGARLGGHLARADSRAPRAAVRVASHPARTLAPTRIRRVGPTAVPTVGPRPWW
jgi:hypothetical protein